MEIVKYICEFFFCNFWHFVELYLLVCAAVKFLPIVINTNKNR